MPNPSGPLTAIAHLPFTLYSDARVYTVPER